MFWSRKRERIEPHFASNKGASTPSVEPVVSRGTLSFEIHENNSVSFFYYGEEREYLPCVTERTSVDQLVLAGLRELEKLYPGIIPTVIDRSGRWTHYLTESPWGSKRKINNVPKHYILG